MWGKREKEREREMVCVNVGKEREKEREREMVCVNVRSEKERENERGRERDSMCECGEKREGGIEGEREGRGREREHNV